MSKNSGKGKEMFTEKFDKYVCDGDSISTEVEGFEIRARIVWDTDRGIDDDDGHSLDQSVTGCNDAQMEKIKAARLAYGRGDWGYCGVVLSVARNGVELSDHAASLWGIEANYPEGDNGYLSEIANELLAEALDYAKKEQARILTALQG